MLKPGIGIKVKSGIKSTAFADALGIKNSKPKMIRYNKITATYGFLLAIN